MKDTEFTIEQIRAAYEPVVRESRPNNYYPFWNMKVDETATIRFLPDLNTSNPKFTIEKLMHNLTINNENRKVPCLKMYDPHAECPICKVSQAFYREEGKTSVRGKQYYRKVSHLAQVLVMDDPLDPDPDTGETHLGKLRFVTLTFQIANLLKEGLKDPELEGPVNSFKLGCNFIIKKTRQSTANGEFDNYTNGTKFSRRSSALTDEQIAVVEEGLVDLSTLLPPKPDMAEVELMLQASLTGAEYDDGKSRASTPSLETQVAATVAETSTQADPVTTDQFEDEAQAVLARIQNRRAEEG